MARERRAGFTLVELLIVAVLGALVVGAIYQTLVANQQTYRTQEAIVQTQRTLRAALEVISGELREVGARGGDIVAIGGDSVRVRALRAFGLVCSVDATSGVKLTVRRMGKWFQTDDSVFVFADGDTTTASDDTWEVGKITNVDTTVTCATGAEAQKLSVSGIASPGDIYAGAPVRAFAHYTYGLVDMGGDTTGQAWIFRRDPGGTAQALLGPLLPKAQGGLSVQYLDSTGSTTTDPAEVRQLVLTIRAKSPIRDAKGQVVSDTVQTRIYVRN